LRAEKPSGEESGWRGSETPASRGRGGSTHRSKTGAIRGVADTESVGKDGWRASPVGILTPGKSRREEAELSGRLAVAIGLGGFAPAHQAGDLVGFRQAVHPAFQAVLVAVFARTKIVAGADPDPAERLAA
jgi:hypothetical protein